MSRVAMQQRITTVWRRSPAFRRLFRATLLMLVLLSAASNTPVWMSEDEPETTGDSCLQYQDEETLDLEKEFVHPAIDKEGCTACHLDCSQLPPAADAGSILEFYLREEQPDLCLRCHFELHPELESAHDDQPLEHSKCSGCHDAHAANNRYRLPEFSHGPYDARLCSACHDEPAEEEVRLVEATINGLCYACHAEVRMRIEGAGSMHKLLSESDESCMDCHDPHAAGQESMLTRPVYELCIGCHEGKPQEVPATEPEVTIDTSKGMPPLQDVMQSKRFQDLNPENNQYIDLSQEYIHEPVRQSCTLCHDSHASEFTAELHASVNDLCMECHGENAETILNSSEPFPFLDGLVSLPPKSYEELPELDLDLEFVHEPVRTSCVFCHDAHASGTAAELHVPVHKLCIACHSTSTARRIINSSQPFPLFDGKVKLPPKVFEKLSQLSLIREGTAGHPIQNHPVYIPATGEEPEFNCLNCHFSHASETGLTRWKESKSKMCLECHSM